MKKITKRQSLKKEMTEDDIRIDLRKFIEELHKTDHYIPSPKDVRRMMLNTEEEAPTVKCTRCGYSWAPNPKMWRDEPKELHLQEDKNGELIRPIHCPACNTKNAMDLKTMFLITEFWERTKILGNILMEEATRAKEKYGYCITATKGLKSGGSH